MLRNLPEGASFTAAMSAPPTDGGPASPQSIDPELEAWLDRKTWTEDRRLQAQVINLLGILIRYSINWGEGNAPEFDVIGPAEWRGTKAQATGGQAKSIDDVLNAFLSSN